MASAMRGVVSDQKAIICVGGGENGKSTLLDALVSGLGRENVSSLTLQRFEQDKFSVVRILGKLANVCADLPADHLTSTSTFKALTGGDRLTGERKFQGSFEFTPFARLIFSTNHYPQSKDASHAFFRRWLVIPFDTVIDPQERIPNLTAKLAAADELSGVLNRALQVLPAMIHRGGFAQNETTQSAMLEFREMTDPLAAWLDQHTILNANQLVSRKDLLISYNAHAVASDRPSMTSKAFCSAVRRLRPTIQEAQRSVCGSVQWVFQGLSLAYSGQKPSHDSHDSSHSTQISLEVKEEIEREENNLKRGNGVNGVNSVNYHKSRITPCFNCHGTRFWVSIHGATVCGSCHPPVNPSLVSEWLGQLPTHH
jgi:P4 family phage/plasmid primase-like protien